MAFDKKTIPKKSDGLSEWYNKVVLEAELADYGPAKGTMIFRPYGYALWESIQGIMSPLIKEHDVENAYFPMFIPMSMLEKEKAHVEGFSPELAVVTVGGGEKLEEPLAIRPTSETIMHDALSRWVHSWRDLPVKMNQWSNVVRWEKRTYMFLRTTEFLWQEGHTAHASHEEARETVQWAMQMYEKVYRDFAAVPGYIGRKSETEKFAGADATLTYEALMPEGKALQNATSHDLGQNFSKAFDVSYQSQTGENEFVWQTSWGLTTRSIGGLLMTHGDDQGLRLPPMIAPIQAVFVPVKEGEDLEKYAHELAKELRTEGIRVKVDDRSGETLGYKINKWELRGVPIRCEVGPKERDSDEVTLVRRDTFDKRTVSRSELREMIINLLEEIQQNLRNNAEQFLKENTHSVSTLAELEEIMSTTKGFVLAPWCEDAKCERDIKEKTKATTRCLPLDASEVDAICVHCGKSAQHKWYFAQSY